MSDGGVTDPKPPGKAAFTGEQKMVVGILAFLQFTIILDFMIVSPLGAIVMPALHIGPHQFGLAVSVYAFSAAFSGIAAAGFADRFDRKKLLLFFYAGFILGTLLCALAPDYPTLLAARVVTGLFGGVIGSVVMAITTDLFPLDMRGRVMGFVQAAFAGAQVIGLPAGIYFASTWNWHAPFYGIVAVAIPAAFVIATRLRPVDAHLKLRQDRSPWRHLATTLLDRRHTLAFGVTMILATGGFMLMPFGSAFIVNNVGLPVASLSTIYLVSGLFTVFTGPLVGVASDRIGKFRMFAIGTALSIVMVAIWTHLGRVGLATVIAVNVILFVGIFSRMVPSQALISAIPEPTHRGSFNAVGASLQQLAGGFASVLAGLIIVQEPGEPLQHFDRVGYVVMATAVVSLVLMYFIDRAVKANR